MSDHTLPPAITGTGGKGSSPAGGCRPHAARQDSPSSSLHVLLVTAAGRRYAIPSSRVVEIVPAVQRQPLARAPAWVYGTINYRGRLILAVDLRTLIGGSTCPLRMVNRIVIVRRDDQPDEAASLVGLLVDAALGSETIPLDQDVQHPRLSPPEHGFLQQMRLIDSRTLQLVDTRQLPMPFEDNPADPNRRSGG